jgi:hypothetical protein
MTDALANPAPRDLEDLEAQMAKMERDPKANRAMLSKVRSVVEKAKAKRALMTPPAKLGEPSPLGLPPLLEKRRFEFGIPDGAFHVAPLFDRVFIWQVSQVEELTHVPGGKIHKIDQAERREKESSVKGVLCAAGATALDALYSNGVMLGDIIEFAFHAPLRKRIDVDARGEDQFVILLQAGDLIGSFDAQERLLSGATKLVYDAAAAMHKFVDQEGKAWTPVKPWVREDY